MNLPPTDMPRDFKGIWIPKEIWFDNTLDVFEKALMSELHSLDGKNGCWASNEYLCMFCNVRLRKLQQALEKLKAKGYIWVASFDGRTRIIRTTLYPNLKKQIPEQETPSSPSQNAEPTLACEPETPSSLPHNPASCHSSQDESVKSLFNTPAMPDGSECNSVKSLFNTPPVSDFAPLPLYREQRLEQSNYSADSSGALVVAFSENEKKEEPKTQVAEPVIVEFPESQELGIPQSQEIESLPSIYPCLLELVEINKQVKQDLTRKFPETVVKQAVDWATHPLTKINTTKAQAIQWACKQETPPSIPKLKEEIHHENKSLALRIEAKLKKLRNATFYALNSCVEICYTTGQGIPCIINYTELGFKDQLHSALRKYGFL
jgi:hypothetical protein